MQSEDEKNDICLSLVEKKLEMRIYANVENYVHKVLYCADTEMLWCRNVMTVFWIFRAQQIFGIPSVCILLRMCFCGSSQGPIGGTGISGFPGLRVSQLFFKKKKYVSQLCCLQRAHQLLKCDSPLHRCRRPSFICSQVHSVVVQSVGFSFIQAATKPLSPPRLSSQMNECVALILLLAVECAEASRSSSPRWSIVLFCCSPTPLFFRLYSAFFSVCL